MRLIFVLLLFWIAPIHAANSESPIRFGLTAVVLTENLRFLDQWGEYLEQRMNYKVEFVLRKSYSDVMDLLDTGEIDFAWICGYPYVQPKKPETFQLLTVPVYRGAPRYHSYIIVHHNSPYKRFDDLKGKVFAFSGFLYPLILTIDKGEKPESFFRQTFFTYNHAETVQAVADQVADGGAVDSYIWEYLAVSRPDITEKTRIIDKSPSFGFPPIVSRVGVNSSIVRLMKRTLETMDENIAGKELLAQLKLDGFGHHPDSLFNGIRAMANTVRESGQKQTLSPTE